MISLPPLDPTTASLWDALLDIADVMGDSWTLVGGQMIFLHSVERRVPPPRISRDLDLVVDVRVRPKALPRMAETLTSLGFEASHHAGMAGSVRRFERGDVPVDILAPEGAGKRVDLRLVGTLDAIEIRGGTAALLRSEDVDIDHAGRVGRIRRPDLAGAIIIKCEARRSDRGPESSRHVRDLAFLCSLVDDPLGERDLLGTKGRRLLRGATELADENNFAWMGLGDRRLDAQLAYRIMSRS